jgi:hypothetical protein
VLRRLLFYKLAALKVGVKFFKFDADKRKNFNYLNATFHLKQ